MTRLLDGNVLIALSFVDHIHASSADRWFATLGDGFATCPITQGSLLRFIMMQGAGTPTARAALQRITDLPGHVFWPDSIPFTSVRLVGVLGHRQVTDAYLAQLARTHSGQLATFDSGLAALHADVAELIPVLP